MNTPPFRCSNKVTVPWLTGIITDKMGEFRLRKIVPRTAYLTVSFIGYKTFLKPSVTVGSGKFESEPSILWLVPSEQGLGTVKIEGEKNMVTLDIDKKVYDVSKNITNIGRFGRRRAGNVPSVSVDVDGQHQPARQRRAWWY